MEGEVAGGSSIEALVDKELLELVFLSPACLNDSHLRILPLVCRRWREVCKSEAMRRAMLAGIVFSFGGQQETSPLGHPHDVAVARCSIPTRIKAFQGTPVVGVAAGWHHSVFLTARGEVFACGNSREGKLGQGEDKPDASIHEPRRVVGLEDVTPVRVVAGAFHTLVLTSTGTLYSFGYGRNGRLGLGDDTNRSVATLITGLCGEEVVQMSGGNMHSLAVTKSGRAYAWGSGSYDLLGLPAGNEDVATPMRIGGAFEAKRVVAASAGDFHNLFLTDDGQVFSCGRDSDGNGRLGYTVTGGQGEPRLIPALADKVATVIAAGEAHSLVATEDGCVFTFGLNARGQLGFGPDAKKESSTQRLENLPTDISKCLCEGGGKVTGLVAASQHSFVVMEDGSVYSFGCGDHFRLGHGTADAVITPKKIERLAPFAIQSVAANGRHTLALT